MDFITNRRLASVFFLALTMGVAPGSVALAATLVVDASGGGDFLEIQPALDAAASGDTVLVQAGEYRVNKALDFNPEHVPGDAGTPRLKNLTLRSEAGPEETVIRVVSELEDPGDGRSLIFEKGESSASVVEGFTFTRAAVTGNELDPAAPYGGVRVRNGSSPTFRNCVFLECSASAPSLVSGTFIAYSVLGSGLQVIGASATVEGCRFERNTAQAGGGIFCREGSLTVRDSTFLRNVAEGIFTNGGAGIYADENSTIEVVGCEFEGNYAQGGGGIRIAGCPDTSTIRNCTFRRNWGGFGGGGVNITDAAAGIEDCQFEDNFGFGGGALRVTSTAGDGVDCEDSVFTGNRASVWGGGIGLEGGELVVQSCTLAGNASPEGGGFYVAGGNLRLTSSIVWASGGGALGGAAADTATVQVSCLQTEEPWPGVNNINRDPLLEGWDGPDVVWVDPIGVPPGDGSEASPFTRLSSAIDGYSVRLSPGSPAIGRGLGGSDMGADVGRADAQKTQRRSIRLAAATYTDFFDVASLNTLGPALVTIDYGVVLALRASLEGVGRGGTVIEGSIHGLRPEEGVFDLTVDGRELASLGISVGQDDAGTIERCEVLRTAGQGIVCLGSTPRIRDCDINENLLFGLVADGLAAPTIVDCRMSANSVAMGVTGEAEPIVERCAITDSTTFGIIADAGARPTVNDSEILRSGSTGVAFATGATGVLRNCTIARNRDGGVICQTDAAPILDRCTIVGNEAASGDATGVFVTGGGAPTIRSSIIWNNVGGAILDADNNARISFSCVQSDAVWPGVGNINENPRFCGWQGPTEVFVDAAQPVEGDGSSGNPFKTLAAALSDVNYSLALANDSPCLGAGDAGVDMGADTGRCESAASDSRRVILRPGEYDPSTANTVFNVSIEGQIAGETVLSGSILGLRTGQSLSNVTIAGAEGVGIGIGARESPEVTGVIVRGVRRPEDSTADVVGVRVSAFSRAIFNDCTIVDTEGTGVICSSDSAPEFRGCFIGRNQARGTTSAGGVFCATDSSARFRDCRIISNVGGTGGGVFVGPGEGPRGPVQLVNTVIADNVAAQAGGGVYAQQSTVLVSSCTVSGNLAVATQHHGFVSENVPTPLVENTIVWGNAGSSITTIDGGRPDVRFSCVEGGFFGNGNIDVDPRFCGFGSRDEVWVDAGAASEGDGSENSPFTTLAGATFYNLALAEDSPCLGSGQNGVDMGADTGTCARGGSAQGRRIHLAAGEYEIVGAGLARGSSAIGASRDDVVIRGTVTGLDDGQSLESVTVTGGTNGGVVLSRAGTPRLRDCRIEENLEAPGIVCRAGSPRVEECLIRRNGIEGNSGGGVLVTGDATDLTLAGCDLLENVSNNDGGAVQVSGGATARLRDCRLEANLSIDGAGVAVMPTSRAIIDRCEIIGNAAVNAPPFEVGAGGALYCFDGNAVVRDSLVAANVSFALGGAVFIDAGAMNSSGAEVTIENSTIVSNFTVADSDLGAPVLQARGRATFNLRNTIVWGNSGDPESDDGELFLLEMGTEIARVSHSIVQGGWPGDNNQDSDPEFRSSGVYALGRASAEGFPDFVESEGDFRLQATSPAIDAAAPPDGAPRVDLAGNQRPCGDGFDIGAYELCGDIEPELSFLRGDCDGDGFVAGQINDAIFLLLYNFTGGQRPKCLAACDADGDGFVEGQINDAIYLLVFNFLGGNPPVSPFPDCGTSSLAQDDALGCEEAPANCR